MYKRHEQTQAQKDALALVARAEEQLKGFQTNEMGLVPDECKTESYYSARKAFAIAFKNLQNVNNLARA